MSFSLYIINLHKEAGTEVEILLDKEKPLLNNGYLIKLIGKRPWNGNQFRV